LGDGDKDFYLKIAERYGIKDKVFFDGLLPSGKPVYDWLDGIDIYLQPSLQEGLPRATIEALSRACPIVGSYAGGIPELISNDLLSSPKDINNFLSKIMLLINNKGKLKYEAEKNFNTSVKYQKIILDKKRSEFWSNFKDYIIKQEKNYGIE
jgi:glycosyltransferase involved in cell wall biosynthesis